MRRVHVICEGQTEEEFVREILFPAFLPSGIHLLPSCIGRVGHKGGRVNSERLRFDLQQRFRDRDCLCTTFFDFYGLPLDFPGKAAAAANSDPNGKQRAVTEALARWAASSFGDDSRRFLPYVQMHEFEALLFSDPDTLAAVINAPRSLQSLRSIRAAVQTPEWINDDPNTSPGKRILRLHPSYSKPVDPVLAASRIGLDRIRRECPLFSEWLSALERLARDQMHD
jgi:hypothetical protein